ncbi:MAG: DUF1549 domain-containing protein, partial [Verrucomicrobiales bacterium]
MSKKITGWTRGLALSGLVAASASAAELTAEEKSAQLHFFETKIRPMLAENCYECHGEKKQKSDLRLDNISYILQGGKSGPALVRGEVEKSAMIEAVSYENPDFQMPPKKRLSESQVADLKKWVAMGAPWPESEAVTVRKKGEFTEEERSWWSFQPVKKAAVPEVDEKKFRVENAVDRFVARKLAEHDLPQAPEAGAREVLRRVYYDLHGLPPSEAEVEAYLKDGDPDKFAKLVDKLLASPRYGERWGQHWLDLVRYAESDGYRADGYRPDAWPYRDYVIKSFNEDKPYDVFVREQLAGDEIAPDDPEVFIGTAFLRNGIYEWNQANAEMQRDIIVKELTGVTSEVFLGLSVACAECHDHKFDPILQEDYYRLRSFLEPVQWREDIPLATPEARKAHEEKMAAWRAEGGEALTTWENLMVKAEESGEKNA